MDDQQAVETGLDGRYLRFRSVLGKGAYKTVYRAFDSDEALEVAWNKLHVERLSKHELEKVSNEVKLLERIQHKNIIRFHALLPSVERNGVKSIDFITEQMTSGTLKDYLKRAKAIKLKVIRRWSFNILGAISYLHNQEPPIMHRDLKCDNIFINGHVGEVKIGDLGLSGVKLREKADSVIGTPEFMAPEVYDGKYTEKVDIYAFGMCLLEMVTMEYPYSECNSFAQIFKKVYSGEKPKVLDRILPGPFKNVINACLLRESNRPSASQLLEDPLFKDWASDKGTENNISLLIGSSDNKDGDPSAPSGAQSDVQGGVIEWSDPLERALLVSNVDDTPHNGQVDASTSDQHAPEVSVHAHVNETGGFKVGLTIPIENQIKRVEFPFDPFIDTSKHLAEELVDVFHLPVTQVAIIEAAIEYQIKLAREKRDAHVRNATPQPPPSKSMQTTESLQSGSAITDTSVPSYAAIAAGAASGPAAVPQHVQTETSVQEASAPSAPETIAVPQHEVVNQEHLYRQEAQAPISSAEHEQVLYSSVPADTTRAPAEDASNFYPAQTQDSVLTGQQSSIAQPIQPNRPVEQIQSTQSVSLTQPVHDRQHVQQDHRHVQQQVQDRQHVQQQVQDRQHIAQQHIQEQVQDQQRVQQRVQQQVQDQQHLQQQVAERQRLQQQQIPERQLVQQQVPDIQVVQQQVQEHQHVPQQVQERTHLQQQITEHQHIPQQVQHLSAVQTNPIAQSSQPPVVHSNHSVEAPVQQQPRTVPRSDVRTDVTVDNQVSVQQDISGHASHPMNPGVGEGATGAPSYRQQQKTVSGHSTVLTPTGSVPVSPMPPPQTFAPEQSPPSSSPVSSNRHSAPVASSQPAVQNTISHQTSHSRPSSGHAFHARLTSLPQHVNQHAPTMVAQDQRTSVVHAPITATQQTQTQQVQSAPLVVPQTYSAPIPAQTLSSAVPVSHGQVTQSDRPSQPLIVHTISQPHTTQTPEQAPATQQNTYSQPLAHQLPGQHTLERQNFQTSVQQGQAPPTHVQASIGHNEGSVPPAPSPPLSVQSNTFASIESVPENSEIGSQQGSEHGGQSVRYVEPPSDTAYSSQLSENDSQTRESGPHSRLPPTAPVGFSTTQSLIPAGSSSISHSASEQVLRRNERGTDLIAPHRSISAPAGSINTDEAGQYLRIHADHNPVLSARDQNLLADLTRPESVNVADAGAPLRTVPHPTPTSNVASESKPPSIVVVGGSDRRHSTTDKSGRTRPTPGNVSSVSLDYGFGDPNYVPRSSSLTGNVSDASKRPFLNEPPVLAPPTTMGRRSSSWRSTQSETSFHDAGIRASPSDTTLGSTYDQKWLASCLELMEHCAKGRYPMVLQKLDLGMPPSFADYDRRTPLHVAASRGHIDIVTLLIERGANMKAIDRWGRTPLSDAIVNRHQNVINFLRSHGATEDMDVLSDAFGSITLESVAKGDLEEVRRRLVAGANVNFADYDSRTALHLACTEGHGDIAELLLVNEADWRAKDTFGRTPVDDAVRNGHKEILRVLRQYGAEIPRHLLGAHSDTQHQLGLDLVENAAKGRINAVKKCLLNGANPNFQDYDNRTPLHLAAVEGHADIVEILLRSGADVTSVDRWGDIPKDGAVKQNNAAVVDEFLNFEKRLMRRNSGASRGSVPNGRRTDMNNTARNFEGHVGEDLNDLRSLEAAAASKMRPSQMHVFADSFMEQRASRSGSRPMSAPPQSAETKTPPVVGEVQMQQQQAPSSPYAAGLSPIRTENVVNVEGTREVVEEGGKGTSSVVTVESEAGEATLIATQVVTSIVDDVVEDVDEHFRGISD